MNRISALPSKLPCNVRNCSNGKYLKCLVVMLLHRPAINTNKKLQLSLKQTKESVAITR